ncbi:hypothetical protein BDN72DRAFT_862269 [Pluteus cervinus]|uniref:Uncharacterized protein n=1 Tax=Pluteus cervinus TaxID=181527 RepID=A0ACD3AC63_9AGAR|nr:hypothetical protein BDN72DRAFT_862269 [Pluteus cervinus]
MPSPPAITSRPTRYFSDEETYWTTWLLLCHSRFLVYEMPGEESHGSLYVGCVIGEVQAQELYCNRNGDYQLRAPSLESAGFSLVIQPSNDLGRHAIFTQALEGLQRITAQVEPLAALGVQTFFEPDEIVGQNMWFYRGVMDREGRRRGLAIHDAEGDAIPSRHANNILLRRDVNICFSLRFEVAADATSASIRTCQKPISIDFYTTPATTSGIMNPNIALGNLGYITTLSGQFLLKQSYPTRMQNRPSDTIGVLTQRSVRYIGDRFYLKIEKIVPFAPLGEIATIRFCLKCLPVVPHKAEGYILNLTQFQCVHLFPTNVFQKNDLDSSGKPFIIPLDAKQNKFCLLMDNTATRKNFLDDLDDLHLDPALKLLVTQNSERFTIEKGRLHMEDTLDDEEILDEDGQEYLRELAEHLDDEVDMPELEYPTDSETGVRESSSSNMSVKKDKTSTGRVQTERSRMLKEQAEKYLENWLRKAATEASEDLEEDEGNFEDGDEEMDIDCE